jgi:hypothetical protein
MDRTDRESSIHPPEVLTRPMRKNLEAEYPLRILEEADRCIQPGQLVSCCAAGDFTRPRFLDQILDMPQVSRG